MLPLSDPIHSTSQPDHGAERCGAGGDGRGRLRRHRPKPSKRPLQRDGRAAPPRRRVIGAGGETGGGTSRVSAAAPRLFPTGHADTVKYSVGMWISLAFGAHRARSVACLAPRRRACTIAPRLCAKLATVQPRMNVAASRTLRHRSRQGPGTGEASPRNGVFTRGSRRGDARAGPARARAKAAGPSRPSSHASFSQLTLPNARRETHERVSAS